MKDTVVIFTNTEERSLEGVFAALEKCNQKYIRINMEKAITSEVFEKAFRQDQGAFRRIRDFVYVRIEKLADELQVRWGACSHSKSEIAAIGMNALERALASYIENSHHLENSPEHFRDYFVWWARQDICAHLQECTDGEQ